MNTKETLQATHDLFDDKKRWCQGDYAQNENGSTATVHGTKAVRWCASGGMYKVAGARAFCDASELLKSVCKKKFSMNIQQVNDSLGYAAIRRMLRKAIKEA